MTPKIHKFDSGLVLIYLPFKGYNTFCADLAVRRGSFGDPAGLEGMAHLVEHLQADKALSFLRAKTDGRHIADDFSAYTLDRRVNYSCTGHRKYAGLAVEALSMCVTPEIDSTALSHEKQRVAMEIKSDLGDASGRHSAELRRAVFSSISGGHLEFGTPGSVKRIGAKQMDEYVKDAYCGRGLVLTVAGDLDFRGLVRDVGKRFAVPSGRAPGKPGTPRQEIAHATSGKAGGVRRFTKSWITKAFGMKDNLLVETLADDLDRHLKETVRKEFGLYSVWADFTRYDSFSWLTVNTEVPGGSVVEFDEAVTKEMDNYINGLDKSVLASAVRSARTDLELRQDFPRSAAQDAQWYYLAFGEVVTSKQLANMLRGTDDKKARRLLRGIVESKSTVVVT